MWIDLFFILNLLETAAFFIINLLDSSSIQERIFLNYSLERLILLGLLFCLLLIMAFLIFHLFKRESKIKQSIYMILCNRKILWIWMWVSILFSAAIYYLFIQPDEWFGSYLVLFQHSSPILFWLLVLNLQAVFFILIWYCANFTNQPEAKISIFSMKEMNWVSLIFLISVVVKVVLILPNTYGLYKDVGESKYFNMIYYLFEGKMLTSADDVTTHYPFLYPLLLFFTYYVKNHTFQCILLVNPIFASSIVFPLYLLSRRVLDRKYSLIVIILSSLIPFQFLTPNRILSENLYFPLLLWSLYLAFTRPADHKERLWWDCLTGFSFGLLYLTRFISLVIIPFLLVIWWLKPFEGVSGIFQIKLKKVLHAVVIILITAAVFSPWIVLGLNNHLTIWHTLGFGITADTNPEQLTAINMMIWLLFYNAYYLLLAAPVLNLIVISCRTLRLTDLKNESSRWLLSLAALLTAFTLGVVRHSWRAYYNLELPTRIMGRYVIYFVPLFLLTGFLGLKNFDRRLYKSLRHFIVSSIVLPATMVAFSYALVISGKIINIGDSFIQPLISIDAYYIQQLGIFFFILILLLYSGISYLLWNGREKAGLFAAGLLMIFYLAGEPACFTYLDEQSTYQKLGYTISETMLQANDDAGEEQDYTIYLSDGFYVDDRKDFAWSLYVRNLEGKWEIVKYPADEKPELGDQKGFVIYPYNENPLSEDSLVYKINGQKFVVEQNIQ